MQIVLATSNPHKIQEMKEILRSTGWTIRTGREFPSVPEPAENGETYEANAEIKARAWAGATGLAALADDSGLEVDALEGRPGILSARYAPTADRRIDQLLTELRGTADGHRGARFVCAAALALPDGRLIVRRGVCPGHIAHQRAGTHGFGYDPIFVVDGCGGRTMAQLPSRIKNTLSHRARALAALLEALGVEAH